MEKCSENTQDVWGYLEILQCVGEVSDPSISYLCSGLEEKDLNIGLEGLVGNMLVIVVSPRVPRL